MKYSATLLAFAASALAYGDEKRGEDYEEKETTLTTYTTTTVCPVTSTYTEEGTTYCVTDLTTSTVTVTECHGCGAQVTTVPGPTVTHGHTTEVEVTYTTVCPITETVTGEGTTHYKTDYSTSVVTTHVPTTIYETVPGPDVTKSETDVEYTTRTSLCPVTETKYVEGKEQTVTYTSTKLIIENDKTTLYETEQLPGSTKTEEQVEYTTRTSLCPVTETKYVEGKEQTVIYTSTKLIIENGKTTLYETEQLPGSTKTEEQVEYTTRTSLCPVTETKFVEGEEKTITYTSTKLIVENGKTTLYETEQLPGSTKTSVDVEYITSTSLCPVTKTETISGKEVTKVYTSTSIFVTHVPTIIKATESIPGQTETQVDVVKSTVTSVYPVTETETVSGQEVTKVYTSTEIYVTRVPTVIKATESLPGHTETEVEVVKSTITSVYAVTETETISGQEVTRTTTSTELIVTTVSQVVEQTQFIPGNTETQVQFQYNTETKFVPVTEVKTVNGEAVTETLFSTQVVVTQIPTTIEAFTTIYQTNSAHEVQTQYSKIFVTVGGGTVIHTQQAPPSVVVIPQTSIISIPEATITAQQSPANSAPVEVPTGAAQANHAPAMALMAGIMGAFAVL
ncbi:hypothetical protein G7046_g2129 [Stylonectria norvegica]|nr:hypothetical protein G7046_g2129 [Stylonectria norvegica]